MENNSENIQNIQADIMKLLVGKTLQKYGANTKKRTLSESERNQLQQTIQSLKTQTEHLLNNLQKKVTENDPTVQHSTSSPQQKVRGNQENQQPKLDRFKSRKRNR